MLTENGRITAFIIFVILLILGIGYAFGYAIGYDAGERDGRATYTDEMVSKGYAKYELVDGSKTDTKLIWHTCDRVQPIKKAEVK